MVEKVATWNLHNMSVCTHCRTTNFSKPAAQHVRIECNKEYLAKVARTEEDYIGGNDDLQGDECIQTRKIHRIIL